MANAEAPEGKVYVCLACGRMSKDRYGFKKINRLWDESCMMNCDLFDETQLVIENGYVVDIKMKEKP